MGRFLKNVDVFFNGVIEPLAVNDSAVFSLE
jgi:hypothetical protein